MAGLLSSFVYIVIIAQRFIFAFNSEEEARSFEFNYSWSWGSPRILKAKPLDSIPLSQDITSSELFQKLDELKQNGIYLIFRIGCNYDPFAVFFSEKEAEKYLKSRNGSKENEQYYRAQWFPLGGRQGIEEI